MENPLVSIIIPVYNGENYVEKAIESAINQTYNNIEIIVIDDGSTDNTEGICKKYKNKIKYIKKKNGGVATALNLGIKEMKGQYFSWLSHDDLYLPNKVEAQINYIQENDLNDVILYSNYLLIDEKDKILSICKKNHDELITKPEYALLTGAVNGITILIPKDAFDTVSLFNEKLRCTQDYDLWFKMQKKYKFIHMEDILSATRIHSSQDSKVSPNVIKEGNILWKQLIDNVSYEKMIKLEQSEYAFYKKIEGILIDSPYDEVKEYLSEKIQKLKNNVLEIAKNQKTKISVIIPFFNREKLTIRAIKSVLNQTYKNFEIILIDDCSTEANKELHNFIKDNLKIKLFRNKKNVGPSESRNFGIEKSSGEYIAFLDSDDEFIENKLEIQLKNMILNNSNASYTDYIKISDKKKENMNTFTKSDNNNFEFLYNCKVATPTIMLKKDFIKNNNIKYNFEYRVCEDICMYLEILKKTNFLYIPEFLSNVYVSSSSCINDYGKRKEGLKNIISYMYKTNYYKNHQKELEILFEGLINFEYLENNSNKKKISIMKKIYRVIIPYNSRVKLKSKLKTKTNLFYKSVNKIIKFEE